jgi:hypothetical protein
LSPKKVQLSLTQITYLGLSISPTQRTITIDHKALLALLPVPSTKSEILSFLGLAGYLWVWVPNFSLMAKPVYEASKGPTQEPLDPMHSISGPFRILQHTLLRARPKLPILFICL